MGKKFENIIQKYVNDETKAYKEKDLDKCKKYKINSYDKKNSYEEKSRSTGSYSMKKQWKKILNSNIKEKREIQYNAENEWWQS